MACRTILRLRIACKDDDLADAKPAGRDPKADVFPRNDYPGR
jgi:hypothetical protein